MNNTQSELFCPYQGLQPFTVGDSEYFFGREEEQEVVTSNLEVAPLTVLYGASGVGKTSVLMAGVVAQLQKKKEAAVVFFRDWQNAEFVSALKKETLGAIKRASDIEINLDESKSFGDFLKECAKTFHGPLLFIFDQFEEYFLYHSQLNGSKLSKAQGANGRVDFDVELARAINRKDLSVNFLLSLREDGLSKLDRLQTRIPNLLGNLLRLDHLNRRAAQDAVKKPLEVYNAKHLGQTPVKAEPKLVEKLLSQVQTGQVTLSEGAQDAARVQGVDRARIETPFLQLVLERLWDAESERWKKDSKADTHWLTAKTLDELGGAKKIVRTHLDSVMARLGDIALEHHMSISGEAAAEIAAAIFRFLVTRDQTKIAYTASDLASFAELPESKFEQLQEVLTLLASRNVRILRKVDPPPGKTGGARYEIFHDVLAPAIIAWRRRYVDDRKLIEAENQTKAERKRAEKEARIASRLRALAVGLAVVSVIAIAFGLYAFRLRAQAKTLESVATQARKDAVTEHEAAEGIKGQLVSLQQTARDLETKANDRIDVALKKEKEAKDATAKLIAIRTALEKEKSEKAIAQTINDKYQEADDAYAEGNLEDSVRKFKETLPLYDRTNNLKGKAAVYSTIGRRYRDLAFRSDSGDSSGTGSDEGEEKEVIDEEEADSKFKTYLTEAQKHFDEARRIYATLEAGSPDHPKEAAILSVVAQMFERSSEKEDTEAGEKDFGTLAMKYYDDALKLYRKSPSRARQVVFTLEKLAEIAYTIDEERALGYNTELQKLYRAANNTTKEAETLATMGSLHNKAGRKQEALITYQQALLLYRKDQNNAREISTLTAMARIYKESGNQRGAVEAYRQLIVFQKPVVERAGRPRVVNSVVVRAGWHTNLAGLYYGLGEKQNALDQHNQAVSVFQQGYAPRPGPPHVRPADRTRYQLGEARVLKEVGKIDQELGQSEKAIDAYTRALQVFETHEIFKEQVEVLRSLAEIHRLSGNQQRATQLLEKAREIETTKLGDDDTQP